MLYTHIWHSSLCPVKKFYSVILKFDEVMPYYARSPREFSIFTWKPTIRTSL